MRGDVEKLYDASESLRFRLLFALGLLLGALKIAGLALLPSFVSQYLNPAPTKPEKVFRTSYLNGLRGVAALLVFVRHYTVPYQPLVELGYGQLYNDETYNGLMRLPFLRLLYDGPARAVFFLISGYVISMKPLKLIHNRCWEALFQSLAVSVFGRGMRLFLPPLLSTFVVMIAVQVHLYDFPYESYMTGLVPQHPDRMPTFWAQGLDWATFVVAELMNPWKWLTTASKYDSHLWTVPIQYKCTMILLTVILALARTRRRVRLSVVAVLFSYCIAVTRWDVALHLAGLFLAELDLIYQEPAAAIEDPLGQTLAIQPPKKTLSPFLWPGICIIGLYLGSFPRTILGDGALGFGHLSAITPRFKTWHAIAAILIVWALRNSSTLQAPFTSPVLLYLGKISFSLYLVHGPVLHMFGYAIVPFMWTLTGMEAGVGYQLGFFMGLLVLGPLVVWAADVFWRLVELPCMEVSGWVERRCFLPAESASYAVLGPG